MFSKQSTDLNIYLHPAYKRRRINNVMMSTRLKLVKHRPNKLSRIHFCYKRQTCSATGTPAAELISMSHAVRQMGLPAVTLLEVLLGREPALRCLEETGADGVMVGRGTMGAPWLVGQIDAAIRGETVPETPGPRLRVELAREQLLALLASKGEHGLLIARKHMSWTCTGFSGASQLRHDLMRAPTSQQALSLLDTTLTRLGAGLS